MSLTPTLSSANTTIDEGEAILCYCDPTIRIELVTVKGKPYIRLVDLIKSEDGLFDFYLIKSTILSLDRSIRKSQEAKK